MRVGIPGVPSDPEAAMEVVEGVLKGLLAQVDADATWLIVQQATEDERRVFGTAAVDGVRRAVGLTGCFDGDAPERWELATEVAAEPIVTTGDKVVGVVSTVLCLGIGLVAGGGAFRYFEAYGFLALGAATFTALVVTMVALAVAVWTVPRSAPPPLEDGVGEGFDERVRAAVGELVRQGVVEATSELDR